MKSSSHLVGRDAELAEIDGLLVDARAGRSGSLLVRGDVGIGKTALLDAACDRADGFALLRSAGIPHESDAAFSGLHDVLRPVLHQRSHLPAPQAKALGAVFALEEGAIRDPLVVRIAAFGLLIVAASDGPLLVAVDDLQWMDVASRDALVFAARHLGSDGIVLLLATRDDDTVADVTGIPELRLLGLDEGAATDLLRRTGSQIDPRVQRTILTAARGNPLALLELTNALTESQRSGDDPIPHPLPVTAGLEDAFLPQIATLPPDTRRALLIAATSDTGRISIVNLALQHAGLGSDALGPALARDIVRTMPTDEIMFRHPLLRACIYQDASTLERREAHAALAEALSGWSDPETLSRRASHLAAAVSPPDEGVARALELAAIESRRRLGHVAAFEAFKRSAAFSGDGESEARRLLEAARAADQAGRPDEALSMLDRAASLTSQREILVESLHLRGRIAMWTDGPLAVHRSLLRSAAEIAGFDPDRATVMAAEAVGAAFMAGDATAIRSAAASAESYARDAGPISAMAARIAALEAAILLDASNDAADELRGYIAALLQEPVLQAAHQIVGFLGVTLIYLEDHANAQHVLKSLVASARESGALSVLPYPLAGLAELHFRSGDWIGAYAFATEAVQLGEETNQASALSFVLTVLARIEGALGKTSDSLAHLDLSDQLRRKHAVDSVELYSAEARGLLEVSCARWDRAVEPLERARDIAQTHGVLEPGLAQWGPNLAETYIRLGREREAAALLDELEEIAVKIDRAWCRGAIGRCRGLLGAADEVGTIFGAALDHHARSLIPFETARTQLVYAEKLFAAGRLDDGVVQLDAARATFRRLGAHPWLKQTERLQPDSQVWDEEHQSVMARLTMQELQVASTVSRGATNKEAAAILFVSVKTIEAHLGNIYRKLGVRSRTELAVLLAGA